MIDEIIMLLEFYPALRIIDIMAEFDLLYPEAMEALNTARHRLYDAPMAAPAWDASDEAAHVAETVDELDVRPVCERCGQRSAFADMDYLSDDGMDWFSCASCRDAYERTRAIARPGAGEE